MSNPHPDHWQTLLDNAKEIVEQNSHVSFDGLDDDDVHFSIYTHEYDCENRYPTLVVSGFYCFGMDFDPVKLKLEEPSCICNARSDSECCCTLY